MADLLNIKTILYVGFRLAPFILVCFFILSSLFNSDVKGLIFLGMLLFNCILTTMIGETFPEAPASGATAAVCQNLNLTSSGPLSKNFPLSVNVFAFTLAYMSYIIHTNQVVNRNIPTFITFTLIIVAQIYWIFMYGCANILYTFFSITCGFGFGWLFSYAVDRAGIVELQYFNGIKNKDVCKRAKNQLFRCNTKQ